LIDFYARHDDWIPAFAGMAHQWGSSGLLSIFIAGFVSMQDSLL
jgi:hypothetical protein